jgi:hypothetical protein
MPPAKIAEDEAPTLLPRRQRAAGERDDDGVVAAQQKIDPDDLQQRDKKRRVEHCRRRPPSIARNMLFTGAGCKVYCIPRVPPRDVTARKTRDGDIRRNGR